MKLLKATQGAWSSHMTTEYYAILDLGDDFPDGKKMPDLIHFDE